MGEGGLSHHFENPENLADQSRDTSCLILSIKMTFKQFVVPVRHVYLRKCMFSFYFARVMT